MLKVSDYSRDAYNGYFEIIDVADPFLADELNVPVGTIIARVYPKGEPCREQKGKSLPDAEAFIKKEMATLRKGGV